jgi:hypothetical protein
MKKIGLLVLALAAVGGLAWWVYPRVATAPWRPALSSREIVARVLGQSLAERQPGAKALVVGNPFTLRGGQSAEVYAFEKASERGLRAGFGHPDALRIVYPELRKEFGQRPESVFVDPQTTTPLSYLVAEDSFQKLAEANPGFELMVSLIGLPVNLTQSPWWNQPGTPRFGLLLPDWRMVGSPAAIREAFKSGKIVAAVMARPGAAEEEVPARRGDDRGEFDRRFILVTQDNIEELLRAHPRAFQ